MLFENLSPDFQCGECDVYPIQHIINVPAQSHQVAILEAKVLPFPLMFNCCFITLPQPCH